MLIAEEETNVNARPPRTAPPNFKVIAFDSWVGGVNNWLRLLESFKSHGIDMSLIHIGSWGSDQGRPQRENIRGLEIRDITSFPDRDFLAIIKSEKPAAVLFLSTETFAHRAFNRYCRQLKIPTLHVFHGIRGIQATDSSSIYKINLQAQVKFVGTRLGKALRRIWPTYAKALWKTAASADEWRRFGKDIFVLALGRYAQRSAHDTMTTMCCVYVPDEIEIAVEKYGFAREDVVAVGNPDLSHFGVTAKAIGAQITLSSEKFPDVMYIDSAFIYSGWVFASARDYVEHLTETREKLDKQGRHLVLKLHPDHFRTSIVSELVAAGFDVCANEDFLSRLQNCCACIVEQSSLALLPALIGMPLFLACYGKLTGQRFGTLLTEYPRTRALVDIKQFNSLLSSEQASIDAEKIRHWIQRNAGPMPAEEMPDRVATVVLEMINGNHD
jgi:hypothetical protein